RSEAYFVFPLAQGTPGKQCGLAATGVYQPSLRSPWLAANESWGQTPVETEILREIWGTVHGNRRGPGDCFWPESISSCQKQQGYSFWLTQEAIPRASRAPDMRSTS
ncbi:hypothetical protein, partial [Thiolapillus sp.]|uniref:hypothetical protein n=1 Tax=Thiolapillus sp. TaxID=2017437 RepID=UPI003AF48682